MDTILGRTAPILIIEAPPRHGKSELVSKYLPAWYLGVWPDRRVILAANTESLVRRFSRNAKAVLESSRELFGLELSKVAKSSTDWEIAGQGGGVIADGVGGSLTGHGANLLIVDDPIKNPVQAFSESFREGQWAWWQSTAETRLEPGAVVIVMATRWHKDDLSGRLIQAAEEGEGDRVRVLHLPAIAEAGDVLGRVEGEPLWPERWPIEALEKKRAGRDVYWWNAMYQQRPGNHANSEWPAEYFGDHIWCEVAV